MDLNVAASGENRSMLGQNLANELGIKIYKEMSASVNDISEAIDTIMLTCAEPSRGLTEAAISAAKQEDSESGFYSLFGGNSTEYIIATGAIVLASIAGVLYLTTKAKH